MAVDTRNRRASCVSYTLQNLGHVWPNPDGAIGGQADRQHIAFTYPGILASAPIAISLFNGLTTSLRLTGAGAA